MKRSILAGVAIAMVLCATLSLAATADVTGTWTGAMAGPDGNSFSLSFTFKQDGAKVTGSVNGPQGDPIPIANGRMDGNNLYFEVSFNGATIKHYGVVDGDSMKLTTKADDPNFPGGEMTLKRAK